ncbi:type II toxin-antitoxin system RelE/ParE family toxin [Alicycliphilus denitrificans]|uniref:type II toxin-antitoxin system RelE/ParE family toxin n=1 Tax=Alicycliphilus denitrificans TaxID=179636 RepID=UPI00384A70E2
MVYSSLMFEIQRTALFDEWLGSLKDRLGQKQILARLARLSLGHWGDCKPVGGEVVELRIHVGPGYRVYCWKDGATVVIALGGGDKSTQSRDIAAAQAMVEMLKE